MTYSIPYGHAALGFEPPRDCRCACLTSRVDEISSAVGEDDLVLQALARPIASPPLETLARDQKSAVIIVSDHTRPVPSKRILPHMLAALRRGNPAIDVTLLVATGFHRLSSAEELRQKLGDDIFQKEKIVVHDSADPSSNAYVGILPSGGRLVVDRTALGADLLVSEGFIEPHFFAGFSGGRKSVLPGVCDRVTVLANHCGAFIASPYARTGNLAGNPIHRDMVAAAQMVHLRFIVNVVVDEAHRVAAAFAGDPFAAHAAGCAFLKPYCAVGAVPADIVVTGNGGAPLDQNIYQSVKCMTAAEATARPDAVLIVCAECADGTGSEGLYDALKTCASPRALLDEAAATPMDATRPDQWEYQILARILDKHAVIFVTGEQNAELVRDMKMTYAPTLAEAVRMALEIKCPRADFTVIPNGVSVIVT